MPSLPPPLHADGLAHGDPRRVLRAPRSRLPDTGRVAPGVLPACFLAGLRARGARAVHHLSARDVRAWSRVKLRQRPGRKGGCCKGPKPKKQKPALQLLPPWGFLPTVFPAFFQLFRVQLKPEGLFPVKGIDSRCRHPGIQLTYDRGVWGASRPWLPRV